MTTTVGVAGSGVGVRLHVELLAAETGLTPVRVRLPRVDPATGKLAGSPPRVETDWLVVATPPFAHAAHVRLGLDSGAMVLCEKPFCHSPAAAARLVAETGGSAQLWVNYQLRCYQPLRGLTDEALLGDAVEIVYRSSAGLRRSVPAWYGFRALGGGVPHAVGSHLIDVLLHMFKRNVEEVRAVPGSLYQSRTASPMAHDFGLEARTLDSGNALLRVTTTASDACFCVGIRSAGKSKWLDLVTGGQHEVPQAHPAVGPDGVPTLSSRSASPWRRAQRCLWRESRRANGLMAAASPAEALSVHEVLAAWASSLAAQNRWVPVERGGP